VNDLELLLASWAACARVRERKGGRAPWAPPHKALQEVLCRLKPDPWQVRLRCRGPTATCRAPVCGALAP